MADRVDLHIGLPKTGTSSLQHILFSHRAALRASDRDRDLDREPDRGVELVVDSMRPLFQAVRDLVHGGAGGWAVLAATVRDTPGRVLLSCEGLSAVPSGAAAAGLAALDCPDVRVVMTLRDPALVLPSVWQQVVRSGATVSFPEFLGTVREGMRWEWLPDPVEVLETWTALAGASNVRLVIAPQESPPGAVLWRRFAAACELDPDVVPVAAQQIRANHSLATGDIELVRRVNVALGDRLPTELPRYRDLTQPMVRRIAERTPAEHIAGLPDRDLAWVCPRAEQLVAAIGEHAYATYGDLSELVPAADPGRGMSGRPAVEPSAETDARSASDDVEAQVIADLLVALRAARRRTNNEPPPAGADRGTDLPGPRRGRPAARRHRS